MKIQLIAFDEYGQIIEGKNLSKDSELYKLIEEELNKPINSIYQQIIITK